MIVVTTLLQPSLSLASRPNSWEHPCEHTLSVWEICLYLVIVCVGTRNTLSKLIFSLHKKGTYNNVQSNQCVHMRTFLHTCVYACGYD